MSIEWISVKKRLPIAVGVYAVAYRENGQLFWCKALWDGMGWESISEPVGIVTHWAEVELPQ